MLAAMGVHVRARWALPQLFHQRRMVCAEDRIFKEFGCVASIAEGASHTIVGRGLLTFRSSRRRGDAQAVIFGQGGGQELVVDSMLCDIPNAEISGRGTILD